MAGAGVLIAILAMLLPIDGWPHISTTQHGPNADYYRLPVCRPGTHFNADSQTCSLCVEGLTYNEVHSREASCKACRVCGENEEQMSQCSITRNARCYCHSDYYRSAEGVCISRNGTAAMGPGGTGSPGRAFMRTAPWSAVSADPAQRMDTDADRSRSSGAQATTAGALGSDSSAARTAAANDTSSAAGQGGGSDPDARTTVAPLDGSAVAQHSTSDPGAGGVSDVSSGQPVEASPSVALNETTAASDGVSDDSSGQTAAEKTTAGAAAVVSDDPAGQPDASVGEGRETTTAAGDDGAGGDAGGQTAADNSPAVRQDEASTPAIEDRTSTDEDGGDGATGGDADGGDGDGYTTGSDPETSDDSSTAGPPDDAASNQPDAATEDVTASASDPDVGHGTGADSLTTGRGEDAAVGGGHGGSRGGHDDGGKDTNDRGKMHEPARPWRIATGVLVGVLTVVIIVGIVFWMFPKTRGYTVNEQRPSVVESGHYSQGDIEMTSHQVRRSQPSDVVVV